MLGWKSSQEKLILRMGPGEGWGYSGYIDLPLKQYSHYIAEYYYVSLDSSTTNIRAEA